MSNSVAVGVARIRLVVPWQPRKGAATERSTEPMTSRERLGWRRSYDFGAGQGCSLRSATQYLHCSDGGPTALWRFLPVQDVATWRSAPIATSDPCRLPIGAMHRAASKSHREDADVSNAPAIEDGDPYMEPRRLWPAVAGRESVLPCLLDKRRSCIRSSRPSA
jgi:hypothetical protein